MNERKLEDALFAMTVKDMQPFIADMQDMVGRNIIKAGVKSLIIGDLMAAVDDAKHASLPELNKLLAKHGLGEMASAPLPSGAPRAVEPLRAELELDAAADSEAEASAPLSASGEPESDDLRIGARLTVVESAEAHDESRDEFRLAERGEIDYGIPFGMPSDTVCIVLYATLSGALSYQVKRGDLIINPSVSLLRAIRRAPHSNLTISQARDMLRDGEARLNKIQSNFNHK